MTKYKFNELPDWARDDLYTRSYNFSDYHRIKSGSDLPTNDVVYLFVRGTWFNKFDLDLSDRSNYNCLLRDYPGEFVECDGYYSLYLMYPITTTRKGKLHIPDEIIESLETIVEHGIIDDNDYYQRENDEVEKQFVEYVQTIAPDIDEEAALDILTEYGERFSEYPWLEDETLVMDKGIDEFILGKLEEGEKAIKENCELITYRGSECA